MYFSSLQISSGPRSTWKYVQDQGKAPEVPERAVVLGGDRFRGGWGFQGVLSGSGWGLSLLGSRWGYGSIRRQPAAIRANHASPPNPLNSKGMTKQQLIEKVAAKTELKKSEVEVAVDSVLVMIAEALQANERVDLRGFGSFVV